MHFGRDKGQVMARLFHLDSHIDHGYPSLGWHDLGR